MSFFAIDSDKCTACGACVDECPVDLLIATEPDSPPVGAPHAENACFDCGHCVAVCEHAALSYHGEQTGKSLRPEDCVPIDRDLYPSAPQLEHLLKSRRAIRLFDADRPVPHETLMKILDSARYAPSGMNMQNVEWSVLSTRAEVSALMHHIYDWMRYMLKEEPDFWANPSFPQILAAWENDGVDTPTHDAPALFVTHSPDAEEMKPSTMCAIRMSYAEITAPTLGVQTCWCGLIMMALDYWKPLRDFLKVPEGNTCHGAMMLGYAKHHYYLQPRRNQPTIHWQN